MLSPVVVRIIAYRNSIVCPHMSPKKLFSTISSWNMLCPYTYKGQRVFTHLFDSPNSPNVSILAVST